MMRLVSPSCPRSPAPTCSLDGGNKRSQRSRRVLQQNGGAGGGQAVGRRAAVALLPLPFLLPGAASALPSPEDLKKAAASEASLWRQEFQLYGRKYKEDIESALGVEPEVLAPRDGPDLDATLARALLDAPLAALAARGSPVLSPLGREWDPSRFDRDRAAILKQELPYARKAKLCGACLGEEDFQGQGKVDRGSFDFLSYVQYKAIARQMKAGPGEEAAGARAREALARAVGDAAVEFAASALVGTEEGDAISGTDADLAELQGAARVLMEFYQAAGYLESSGISFFGTSKNEERNKRVWVEGESAYIKVWLYNPAVIRFSGALEKEEGFAQNYVANALESLLRRRGVGVLRFSKYPSLREPTAVAHQWTVYRLPAPGTATSPPPPSPLVDQVFPTDGAEPPVAAGVAGGGGEEEEEEEGSGSGGPPEGMKLGWDQDPNAMMACY